MVDYVRSMPAGKNHVTYSRPARRLRPGRYRARINARDCGGRRSQSHTVPFVVVATGLGVVVLLDLSP